MPSVEFRRAGGNDALSVGGSSFFAKDHFYVLRAWEIHLISTVVCWGIGLHIHLPEDRIIFFENGRTYFHGNQFPNAVFSEMGFHLNHPMTFLRSMSS